MRDQGKLRTFELADEVAVFINMNECDLKPSKTEKIIRALSHNLHKRQQPNSLQPTAYSLTAYSLTAYSLTA